jgi:sterol desaturase/sphingolipid hydroxylase (fatty acid hydroxylase superfamily)
VTGFLLAFAATALLLFVMCFSELVAPIEQHPIRSKLPGIAFSLVNSAATVWLLAGLEWAWSLLGVRPIMQVPVSSWTGQVAAVALSLLFYDFLTYWNHRFQHRFLWRFHALHHCQTDLYAANSYAHFTERGFRFLLLVVPLSLVQFDFPAAPFFIIGLQKILELYIHSPTQIHLGPLGALFVDNRFHRIHHSLEERHFDKNFGVLFSVWDRLFGTAYWPAPDEWPETGVAGLAPPGSIGEYLLYPWRTSLGATIVESPTLGAISNQLITPKRT